MESVVVEAQEGTDTAVTLRRRKQNLLSTLDLAMVSKGYWYLVGKIHRCLFLPLENQILFSAWT